MIKTAKIKNAILLANPVEVCRGQVIQKGLQPLLHNLFCPRFDKSKSPEMIQCAFFQQWEACNSC